MEERCYCDVEDREPVMDADARGALRCPGCGCLDYMDRFPTEVRIAIWSEAKRSRGIRHLHPPRQSGRGRHSVRLVAAPGGVAFVEVVEGEPGVRAESALTLSAK